jgi:hypothetical protein
MTLEPPYAYIGLHMTAILLLNTHRGTNFINRLLTGIQLETGETSWVEVPAFSQGRHMLVVQNNLRWLSTMTNVPMRLALRTPARTLPPLHPSAPHHHQVQQQATEVAQ